MNIRYREQFVTFAMQKDPVELCIQTLCMEDDLKITITKDHFSLIFHLSEFAKNGISVIQVFEEMLTKFDNQFLESQLELPHSFEECLSIQFFKNESCADDIIHFYFLDFLAVICVITNVNEKIVLTEKLCQKWSIDSRIAKKIALNSMSMQNGSTRRVTELLKTATSENRFCSSISICEAGLFDVFQIENSDYGIAGVFLSTDLQTLSNRLNNDLFLLTINNFQILVTSYNCIYGLKILRKFSIACFSMNTTWEGNFYHYCRSMKEVKIVKI